MEMGRRWTPENLAEDQLVSASLVLAAQPGAARLLQHALLPARHHPAWLRGRRRIDHVRVHHAASAGQGLGHGSWKGLADWKSEMPRHYDTASRMLGVIGEPYSRSGGQVAAAGGRLGRNWQTRFTAPALRSFSRPRECPPGRPFPTRTSAAKGPERTTCKGCGGCMMGCQSRREEHARPELSVPGRKARRASFRRDARRRCSPARRQPDGSAGYEVHTVTRSSRFQRQSATLHLPRRGLFGLVARHHGAAVPPEGQGLAAGDQRSAWQATCAPTPSR